MPLLNVDCAGLRASGRDCLSSQLFLCELVQVSDERVLEAEKKQGAVMIPETRRKKRVCCDGSGTFKVQPLCSKETRAQCATLFYILYTYPGLLKW